MHFYNLKFYCFIDKYDKSLINNLKNNVSVIYRNYSSKSHLQTVKKIKRICNKRGLKFYLSNNIKLAISLNLDGAYIPSFNKDLVFNSFSFKKNFKLLGSAHTLKEIRIKEKQNINYIFLSPLFKNKKNKTNLGIYRFIKLKNLTKKNVVALGGIKKTNFNIIKKINTPSIASISLFQK
jgi:thiamine-phosphate pyrophosphorylase